MPNKIIKNMITLLHRFFYFKLEDEEKYHKRIHDNVTYTGGVFKNSSSLKQEINLTFEGHLSPRTYTTGLLKCTVNPHIPGQVVHFYSDEVNTTATIGNNGYCYSDTGRFNYNSSCSVTVENYYNDGVNYQGGNTTITITR